MCDKPVDGGHVDWQRYRFSEIENDELFWREDNVSESNGPMRKRDENSAYNLKDRTYITMKPTDYIYQKEY